MPGCLAHLKWPMRLSDVRRVSDAHHITTIPASQDLVPEQTAQKRTDGPHDDGPYFSPLGGGDAAFILAKHLEYEFIIGLGVKAIS